jgi:C4-dicarboxylate-specific signal transduction histidine kinase
MPHEFRTLYLRNMRLQPWLVGGRKTRAGAIALIMIGLIALLDFATGYEIRLAMLYLLPIALATWTGRAVSGMLMAFIAVLCWGASFYANNIYSREIFYIWEGCVLAVTFAVFVLLLARLRSALENADRRFRDVLDGLSASVYAVRESAGTVLYANRHLCELLQVDPVGRERTIIEGRFKMGDMKASAVEPKAAVDRFRHDEAHDELTGKWYLVQSGDISWETGERVQLKVLMDITEQRQALALQQQHQDMLHNTARFAVLAEIASMIGHEINQPLMAISTYTSAGMLLLSRPEPDINEAMKALEKAMVQVTRSSDIVERTRGFLRRRTPTMSDGDINNVVRSVAQSMELSLQDPLLTFQIELASNLPALIFDQTLIEQVVANLLSNALDAVRAAAGRDGRIGITTDLTSDGSVHVSVRDNGVGLPAVSHDALYRPFYTTKPEGLGLGLSICRSVIEAHAGRLWHDTCDVKGTTFQFTLPCVVI